MATMRRDPVCWAASVALIGCLATQQAAHAQSQQNSVTPTLNARLEHTDNVDGASDRSATGKRSEEILTVAPAIEVQHRGPNTVLEGRFGLLAEHRLQGTSSDRVVPDGRLRLRMEPGGHGAGLEAALQAQQVKSSVSSSSGTSNATANSVTESQASVAPFFERRLGENHELFARAQGLRARTDPRLDTSRETSSSNVNAQIGLTRRPTPFGYAFESSTLRERQKAETPVATSGASFTREDGRTEQRAIRAKLLYAFGQEFDTGLILGYEKDRRRLNTSAAGSNSEIIRDFDGDFFGIQATWRPGPRTTVSGLIEDRKAARTWQLEASHRLRRTTFSFTDQQVATRNAPSSLSGSAVAGTTVPLPPSTVATPPTPNAALPLSEQSTALLSIQRTTGLRVTYGGVRTVLSLIAGQFRARSLIATGDATSAERSRYHGTELSYRLSSQVTPSMGLRWSNAKDSAGQSRREQLFSLGVRVRLTPDSSVEGGAVRLSSRSSASQTSASDRTQVHSVFLMLEHRF